MRCPLQSYNQSQDYLHEAWEDLQKAQEEAEAHRRDEVQYWAALHVQHCPCSHSPRCACSTPGTEAPVPERTDAAAMLAPATMCLRCE